MLLKEKRVIRLELLEKEIKGIWTKWAQVSRIGKIQSRSRIKVSVTILIWVLVSTVEDKMV